ncbi:MmcQ/YjbR family DNA-binding protein [Mucilaginibacter sp. UYCu711]|uniref:MmcQ/YjbR family DNA-binding protein n=1 Tax=Mucilaginibacter sp. UYCu711 TaxID=3156339 RepID=UPI003D22A88D
MANDPFIYWEFIRKVLLAMPGVTEGKAYGTPAFHVKKKFMLRLKEDGQTLAVYHEEREKWIGKDPKVFFLTDHYLNYPYVLVNLEKVDPVDLEKVLIESWYYRAPEKLIKEYSVK